MDNLIEIEEVEEGLVKQEADEGIVDTKTEDESDQSYDNVVEGYAVESEKVGDELASIAMVSGEASLQGQMFATEAELEAARAAHQAAMEAEQARYDAARTEYETAREAYEKEKLEEQERYESALAEYEAAKELFDNFDFEAHAAAVEAYNEALDAYNAALSAYLAEAEEVEAHNLQLQAEHLAAMERHVEQVRELTGLYELSLAEYEASKEAHDAALTRYVEDKAIYEQRLEEWNNWQNVKENPPPGSTIMEGVVMTIERVNINLSDKNNTSMNWEVAPGIWVTRGNQGNSALYLTINEGAQQGILTFYAAHGNNVQKITVNVYEVNKTVELRVHPNSNMSDISSRDGFSFVPQDKPVFDGQEPTFDAVPPENDLPPPPPPPELREPELEMPALFTLERPSGSPTEPTAPTLRSFEFDEIAPTLSIYEFDGYVDNRVSNPPIGDPPSGDSPSDDLPSGNPPSDTPPSDGAPAGNPPVGDTPISTPPESVPGGSDESADDDSEVSIDDVPVFPPSGGVDSGEVVFTAMPDAGPFTAPAPIGAPTDIAAETETIEVIDDSTPLGAFTPPEQGWSETMTIDDNLTPLGKKDSLLVGDLAGVWTNGLIFTLLLAACVGRIVRKLRKDDNESV